MSLPVSGVHIDSKSIAEIACTREGDAITVTFRAVVRVVLQDGSYRDGLGIATASGDEHAARSQAIQQAISKAEASARASLGGEEAPAIARANSGVPKPRSLRRRSPRQDTPSAETAVSAAAEEAERQRREEEGAAAAAEEAARLKQEEEEAARLKQEKEAAAAAAAAAAEAEAEAEAARKAEEEAAEAQRLREEEEEAARLKAEAEEKARESPEKERSAGAPAKSAPSPSQVRRNPNGRPAAAARPKPLKAAVPRSAPKPQARGGAGRGAPAAVVKEAPQVRKQLSLSSRKNVKQNQPHFAEHVSQLQQALNLEVQVQSKVDWHQLAEICDEGNHKNQCGEIFYDQVMKGLVTNLCRLSADGRDNLVQEWTTGAIALKFDEEQDTQWTSNFLDGEMELVCRGQPWLETETVGLDLVADLGGDVGASGGEKAAPQVVGDEWDKAFAKHAARIQEAVDLQEMPVAAVNFEELASHLAAHGLADDARRIFLDGIVGSLAQNICDLCRAPLVAPAIRKLWATSEISLAFNEQQSADWNTQLLRGSCVITVHPDAVAGPFETVGKHVVDMVCDDESGLPILSAQSMQDHDATIQDHLERIRSMAGLQFEIVTDVDFFEVCSSVNEAGPEFEHSVGAIWAGILDTLAFQVESAVMQPEALDTLANLWQNAVIKLQFDDTLDNGMWQCDFLDGDLVLFTNPQGVVYYEAVGEDLADRLYE